MLITSEVFIGDSLIKVSEADIKKEPMLHRADREFAYNWGGPLTRQFLSKLSWKDIIVDSRVHMLMPGMYPCIPGWHHDDVPREREDGQPNYVDPSYKAEHCMALWGDCSLTEFAIGEHLVDIPPVGHKIYKELSPIVERLCEDDMLQRVVVPEGRMIYFDWETWHRGTPATKNGFRFFIRATRWSKLPAKNEIRLNANVYMPVIEEGW